MPKVSTKPPMDTGTALLRILATLKKLASDEDRVKVLTALKALA